MIMLKYECDPKAFKVGDLVLCRYAESGEWLRTSDIGVVVSSPDDDPEPVMCVRFDRISQSGVFFCSRFVKIDEYEYVMRLLGD